MLVPSDRVAFQVELIRVKDQEQVLVCRFTFTTSPIYFLPIILFNRDFLHSLESDGALPCE